MHSTHLIVSTFEPSSTTSRSEDSLFTSGCFGAALAFGEDFAGFVGASFLDFPLALALLSAHATRSLASRSLPGEGDGEGVFAIFGSGLVIENARHNSFETYLKVRQPAELS